MAGDLGKHNDIKCFLSVSRTPRHRIDYGNESVVIHHDSVQQWMRILVLFSQQLEKADDPLHYRMNTVAGFKMNPDNFKSTLQRVRLEQGRPNPSIAEGENSFLCAL
jgi:hypothetical protein